MHLVAQGALEFEVAGARFTMQDGETIHTENSHKFNRRTANMLLLAGGWEPRMRWLDKAGRFALILASAQAERGAP